MDNRQGQTNRAILIVVLISNFLVPFAGTALNVAVPMIGSEFRVAATTLTWIVSAYMISTVALSVPFGRIADIRGKRTVFMLGVAIFAATSFLVTLSHGMAMFIIFRIIMGAGAAMIFATNMPILIAAWPKNKRGRVIGIYVSMVYIGLACGPVLGGLLTGAFGWRYVQYLIALLSVVALIISLLKLPKEAGRPASQSEGGIDPASVLLFVCAIIVFLYGFTAFGQNILSYACLAGGFVLLLIYLRYETRSKAPIFQIRVFRSNAPFLRANLAALFNYAATYAVGYIFAIYLQLVKGYPANIAGIILITQPVIMAIVAPLSGRLSERRSPFMLAAAGMAFTAAALFSFVFIGVDSPLWQLIAGLIVVGFGFGLFSSPNANTVMSSVEPKDFGVASSVQSTARTMGQVIGMALITIVTNFIIGKRQLADVPKALYVQNLHIAFVIFAALCAVGIFICLNRAKEPTH